MVGGFLARTKPLTCCLTSASSVRRPCFPRLEQKGSAAVSWNHTTAAGSRSKPGQLRVAQQFGDTLTDVSTANTAQQQQVPLQDAEDQLRAAVEEAVPVEVPPDVLTEFEHELEEDLASVAVTLTAVTGVIIFWRGVWSLLDYFLGDSIFGDICCIFVGLTIVLGIRLSGVKVSSSFWPPS